MGRKPCCAKEGLNRGAWSAREDTILSSYIKIHGEGKWRDLPQRAGLKRCGKSCRLRWLNYLRPDIKRGNISTEEEELIIRLHKLLGNRWSLIAGRLPGRTDNEIKNYWNTNLSKRVEKESCKSHHHHKTKMGCTTAASTPPLPETEHPKLIRTKAVKCTRAIVPRPLEDDHKVENNAYPAVREDDSTDFLIDIDIDELLMTTSDALNWDLKNNQVQKLDGDGDHSCTMLNTECENGDLQISMMDEESKPYSYSSNKQDETDNWLPNDDNFRSSELLDLRTIASYLNSEDGWID